MSSERDESHAGGEQHENTQERASERGDVAEPDAPTSGEENESMSTILSADPLMGVQKDKSEE